MARRPWVCVCVLLLLLLLMVGVLRADNDEGERDETHVLSGKGVVR